MQYFIAIFLVGGGWASAVAGTLAFISHNGN